MGLYFDFSHHVVDRGLLGSEDGDPTVRVDNAIASVALAYGDGVRVVADRSLLDNDPIADRAFSSLSPVSGGECRIGDGERRARLPEDRHTVERLLDFDGRFETDTNAWLTRLHGIEEFAVFAGGEPIYRSVPHEHHIRGVNGAVSPFVTTAADAVSGYRGVAILPVDPLFAWHADDTAYELHARGLRIPEQNEKGWRWFPLSKLVYVRPAVDRAELTLQWQEARGISPIGRGQNAITKYVNGEPPKRLSASHQQLRGCIESLARLQHALDYEYRIDAADLNLSPSVMGATGSIAVGWPTQTMSGQTTDPPDGVTENE